MKPQCLALVLAAVFCVIIAGLLVWFWPLSGSAAISAAKSKYVYSLQDETWGELIADYEEATGVSGTWRAKRSTDERFSWDVTYTHPGIGILWLGIGHTWDRFPFTNETSVGQQQRMLEAISERGAGARFVLGQT